MGSLPPTWSTIVAIDVLANFAGLSNAANVTAVETDPDTSNNIDSEGTVVNIPSDAVRFFTAKATTGQNRLEWLNPTPVDYVATHIVVNTTRFPANETDGTVIVNGGTAGAKEIFDTRGSSTTRCTTTERSWSAFPASPPANSPADDRSTTLDRSSARSRPEPRRWRRRASVRSMPLRTIAFCTR